VHLSTGEGSSNLVKILVPIGVLVLVLVITGVVVVVVIGAIYAKKKREGAYTFQRMAFNSTTEDVEVEG
jgi:lipopolysaccharide/colanic/teichoic acid biosynthesis glycosyltransferase